MNPTNRRFGMLRVALPKGLSALALAAALSGCSASATPTTPATPATHPTPATAATAATPATSSVVKLPVTAAPSMTGTTKSTSTAGSSATFGDGTYKVGKDVQPGTYRAANVTLLCDWTRYGAGQKYLGSAIVGAPTVVTILATDVSFKTDGCGTWTSDLSQVTKSKTSFGAGTFIVATDVTPGTYKSDGSGAGSDKCFWARLSGFGGTLDETTQNFVEPNPATVVIRDTDKGFQSQACGTWTKQ